ncbi:4-alpha-glucanotransferase [Allonocardiopsis opalescens]|uniref:4-alpha-glucanotransferase n=1 Tax=Allonocardiopsis opalescens TaxID=1144618 RepID=A0A2T0PXE3_9ACTN|nr:4-alpha-glucanotransferase [Allonocardiopsis opalescens]PRX96210.1 4-alpha-glucanotransferase [Allonocardiopsis opalescens]
MTDHQLAELAREHGVAVSYDDWSGRPVDVSPETLRCVLGALGVDATRPAEALARLRAERERRLLPPAVVLRRGRPLEPPVPEGTALSVVDADGAELSDLGALPLGFHRLHAKRAGAGAAGEESAPLLVVPDRLSPPPALGRARAWGLMAQLYSVRSRGSWSFGDLRDLATVADWSAREHGAGFVLINPVHATEPAGRIEPSPYLPVSRRYVSPLYLRIEDVPEYAGLDSAERERIARLSAPLRAASATAELIDRDAVWAAKRAALEALYRVPRSPEREARYRAYLRREGACVDGYAAWCAIAEQHGTDYRAWPAELRDVAAVRPETAAERWPAADFHRWVQWLLDEQLESAQGAARAAGMPVGIVHDLAVGVQPGGADAWMYQDAIAGGITVGAPPDEFNQQGQNWGQPPWHPGRLAAAGYAPLALQLRQALRHAGGIRVDHVMGLFRLWWTPEGASPKDGTYVRYDHEGLVGTLALVAQQNEALVIGEDLGTVEPWVREHLAERGVLGTSVLWFEREPDGTPAAPGEWRRDCLATVATHDLPPAADYLTSDHVELRARLGLLARPAAEELAEAEAQVAAWRRELAALGLLEPGADLTATIRALHAYLARTPCRLVGIALNDLVGDRRIQNVPGTSTEYPNWRVPLSSTDGRPVLLEDLPRLPEAAATLPWPDDGSLPQT